EGGQLKYTVSLVDKDGNAVTLPAGKSVTLNLAWSGAAAKRSGGDHYRRRQQHCVREG
ncbi:hypothetical protein HA451_21475, partial [Aeromonas veronii]|nr:hypothetical protein [Aeromonas veronii]